DCRLIVSDNGPGLPEDFDLEETDSLGLKIVRLLAEKQLKGEFSLESDEKGTTSIIKFSQPD
ncbi:MAG: ATP-binding protein, partial [bacterium]